jgi:hypothetical protein
MFGVRSKPLTRTGLSRAGRRARWASGLVVLAMVAPMGEPVRADTVVKVPNASGTFDASVVAGDFNGDGRTDLALTGASTWRNVPVAFSHGDGSFDLKYSPDDETDEDIARFSLWAAAPGAQILTGDFNGDGRTDLALTGASAWRNVPVAFSNGDGSFKVTSAEPSDFASWASEPGVTVTTGDFNNDGRTDVALTPGPRSEWTGLPVALSNGDGTFEVTNKPLEDFATLARVPGVRVTAGDFNNDGRTDVVLIPGPESEWTGLPVALSNGDGTFEVTNEPLEDFATLARVPGVKVTAGDFNNDGRTDLALTGGAKWETIPVAFSNGDGKFEVTDLPAPNFTGWAQVPGVKVTAGDFNNDGSTDLALTGGAKWETMPVAFSNGDGTFEVTNEPLKDFAGWAQAPGATVVSGDFDANGATDMVLTGAVGWTTVPVAWSNGEGHFTVTNSFTAEFAKFAALPGPSITYPGTWYGRPYGLLVSEKMVTVNWFDRSDNERGFRVEKRDKQGNWQMVHQVPTRNVLGSGLGREDYTWVDTSRSISGQCYRIGAYNDTDIAYTEENCTVRPDPDEFPQNVATAARQWNGLSSTNDGTGSLYNDTADSYLAHGEQTFGVNLNWADTSLWRVQAQGGPHLMKGQAVAIRVWGGGWLRHGSQTFGVNLELDDSPSYEWYVIGDSSVDPWSALAGEPLASGAHLALWNSVAEAYLVYGYQTWGINLKWYVVGGSQPPPPPPNPTPTGIKTYRVVNCTWPEAHTLQLWVKDLTAGSPWIHVGSQQSNWTDYGTCGSTTFSGTPFSYNVPISGHYYELVAVDSDPDWCFQPQPDPNVAFNCVRMDSTPFLGSTTSSVVATATVN